MKKPVYIARVNKERPVALLGWNELSNFCRMALESEPAATITIRKVSL